MPTAPVTNPSTSRRPLLVSAVVLLALAAAGGVYASRRAATAAPHAANGVSVGDLARANLTAQPDMCSGRNLKGSGARMDVFVSADTAAPTLQSGLVPMLDVNVTPKTPALVGQTVRWSGWIKAHGTGTHRFALPAGVHGQLAIARQLHIDTTTGRADSTGTDMVADRFYPFTLVVTVDRAALDAGMWLLSWTPPSGTAEPVMRGSLFPPTPSTAKAPVVASATPAAH